MADITLSSPPTTPQLPCAQLSRRSPSPVTTDAFSSFSVGDDSQNEETSISVSNSLSRLSCLCARGQKRRAEDMAQYAVSIARRVKLSSESKKWLDDFVKVSRSIFVDHVIADCQ